MKKLKTAPQFLEHYLSTQGYECSDWFTPYIIKAMRSYKNYKLDLEYENIRKEAIENVEFQYKQEEIIEAQKIKKYMLEHSITK